MSEDDEQAFNRQLGRNIRTARLARGWSEQRLAAACGLCDHALADYEDGTQNPGLQGLQLIADALGVTSTSLLPK
jgi:transcriptional regulator with XRE-family HTH domain